jgi:hypothetical protein
MRIKPHIPWKNSFEALRAHPEASTPEAKLTYCNELLISVSKQKISFLLIISFWIDSKIATKNIMPAIVFFQRTLLASGGSRLWQSLKRRVESLMILSKPI